MKRVLAITVAVTMVFAISGCRKKRARVIPPAPPAPVALGATETGVASWYGHPYHGRASASGEIYDMEQMTAAHRTLPFQTWVRVQDVKTGKTVDVRINDRGPFVDGRIIDLSHAAAREIQIIGPGTARVRLEVIRTPASASPGRFAVQVGAFRQRQNAERLRGEMERKYGSAKLVLRDGTPPLYRVLVGREPSESGAGSLADRIRKTEKNSGGSFVVRLDG